MFVCIELLCAVLFCIMNKSISEEFKYKVVAPEYVCSQQNMSQTAIRLVGEDVPKLEYNLSVGFKLLNSLGFKQRNVLMVWRSVRNLEKAIQTLSADDINRGIIFINNTMLTTGIKYEFNITAKEKDTNKTTVDYRHFTLEYVSEMSSKSAMSAYLTGPDVTYADINYVAQAEVTSCSDNPDYKLSWQLLDSSKKIVREESTKSRILMLPPGTLVAGKTYTLKCLVHDNKSNKNKTSPLLRINVLQRGMQLDTYTKYLKIGLKQPISLNAYFSDPDCIKGELAFEWECSNSGNEGCAEFESNNSTELLIPEGFSVTGSYLFTVKAKKGTASASASSRVEVSEEMVPVIDVENAMTSCNPSESLKISAHVSQLDVGCTVQWISVQDNPEYTYIDLSLVPGDPGKLVEITEQEEEFQELAEYNNTLDKQHDFILSAPNESWKGLNSNSKYLFRLIVTCPCSENNSSDNENKQKFISSSVDVEVTTNASPVMKLLEVNPITGEALRTIFTYNTELPTNCSNPLSYKFGYIIKKQKKIYLIQQYETSNAVTFLPYDEEPIQTMLEVCDSRSACNFTLGPKVTVKLPINFSETETLSFINRFNKSIFEQDYFSAFTLASILLKTSSKMVPNNTFITFDTSIKNITRNEIKSFLKATDDFWIQPASGLLKHIKILADEISLPEDILDDILGLRDKVSEKQSKNHSKSEKLRIAPPLTSSSRKLLSLRTYKKSKRIVNDINIDEIKDYLEISELAIKRLTDFERVEQEKQKLREKLENYVPRICQFLYNNYKTDVRIELSTFIFAVEKINLIRKYNEFIFVPYKINSAAKILLGRDIADRHKNQNGVCIGKIYFIDDYFHIPQYVYNVNLYTATADEQLNSELDNFGIIIEMPIKSTVSNNQILQCVLWEDSQWNFDQCKTLEESKKRVKCICKTLGYYSIVPIERVTTATVSTLKTSTKIMTQDTVGATTVTNQQIHVTQVQSIRSANQSSDYKIDEKSVNTGETKIKSAAIWSITIMSIGIFSLLFAFLMLFKRLKRTDAIQNFHTIEYAKYFDEHNME